MVLGALRWCWAGLCWAGREQWAREQWECEMDGGREAAGGYKDASLPGVGNAFSSDDSISRISRDLFHFFSCWISIYYIHIHFYPSPLLDWSIE